MPRSRRLGSAGLVSGSDPAPGAMPPAHRWRRRQKRIPIGERRDRLGDYALLVVKESHGSPMARFCGAGQSLIPRLRAAQTYPTRCAH